MLLLKPTTNNGKPPKDWNDRSYPPIKKQDGSWSRSDKEKAETFATQHFKVFKPNAHEITLQEENLLLSDDIISATLHSPTRSFTIKKVRNTIKNLNPQMMIWSTVLGYDLITN